MLNSAASLQELTALSMLLVLSRILFCSAIPKLILPKSDIEPSVNQEDGVTDVVLDGGIKYTEKAHLGHSQLLWARHTILGIDL